MRPSTYTHIYIDVVVVVFATDGTSTIDRCHHIKLERARGQCEYLFIGSRLSISVITRAVFKGGEDGSFVSGVTDSGRTIFFLYFRFVDLNVHF